MQERSVVEKILSADGRVYIVGGWVRDKLRGVPAHDKDYVVTGITAEKFQALFPEAICIGRFFPVFCLKIDGKKCEIALGRRERKQGIGYRGFSIQSIGDVSIEEDLKRRDTTINSMALELPSGKLLDPYNGQRDIKDCLLRAVSGHFVEDPVRALRVARQASELGFSVTPETIDYMSACCQELLHEPGERVFAELKRALASPQPSVFFRVLQRANLLQPVFPEIFSLIGKTQPAVHHPEGDAFEHTMQMVDMVAQETEHSVTRFSALVHDLGKGLTPIEMEPHHYGHERRGREALAAWAKRLPFPQQWLQAGNFVIAEHMRAGCLKKAGKIVKLLLELSKLPLAVNEFNIIIEKDHKELPEYLKNAQIYLQGFYSVHGTAAPKGLQGKAVGEWIFQERIRLYEKLRRGEMSPKP